MQPRHIPTADGGPESPGPALVAHLLTKLSLLKLVPARHLLFSHSHFERGSSTPAHYCCAFPALCLLGAADRLRSELATPGNNCSNGSTTRVTRRRRSTCRSPWVTLYVASHYAHYQSFVSYRRCPSCLFPQSRQACEQVLSVALSIRALRASASRRGIVPKSSPHYQRLLSSPVIQHPQLLRARPLGS